MNLRLTDHLIRSTCRHLLQSGEPVSGRRLRRELRQRFGSAGKTARVFAIWREEAAPRSASPQSNLPMDVVELQARLVTAEAQALAATARAEIAEFREQAHQDHWALEIDRLREEGRARPALHAELRQAQDRLLRVTAELAAARALLAERS